MLPIDILRRGSSGASPISLYATPVFNTTAGNKSITVTPAIGDLIIVCVCSAGNTATVVSDNQGGSYTLIRQAALGGGTDIVAYYRRTQLVTSAVAHVITCTMTAATGGGIAAYKITNMASAGSNIVAASSNQQNQAGGTPAPVLPAPPQLTNFIFGTCFTTTETSIEPRPGYVEDFDASFISPAMTWQFMHKAGGETSATITWGSALAGAAQWGAAVFELNISAQAELAGQLPAEPLDTP